MRARDGMKDQTITTIGPPSWDYLRLLHARDVLRLHLHLHLRLQRHLQRDSLRYMLTYMRVKNLGRIPRVLMK